MSNVLFVNGPASGHVYPTLGLVEELVQAGEQVYYVSSEEYREPLERLGAVFAAYDNFLKNGDPFQTRLYLSLVIKILKSYEVILPCIMELAKRQSFDYIIHDSMYGCGNVLADMLGLPHIAICTSFIGAEVKHEETRNPDEINANLRLVRQFADLAGKVRDKFGIRRRLDIDKVFFNEGLLNLVCTSSHFQPDSGVLGEHYCFVGPCLTERGFPTERPVVRKGHRTVYISLGTQFNHVQAFYELCFEALAGFDGHVTVSVGNRIDPAVFPDIPGNFTVLPFVDQLDMLKTADVFITHGGMNSVNEALYFNVPLIVIPQAADQPLVGKRVEALGAGLMLHKHTLTADTLRDAVEHLLSDRFNREPLVRLGESLRTAGGQQKAMEEIQRFKKAYSI
ncbi:MAG: glycosyl transferase family 1 [Paenibacillaceae bacterium]|jgi:MGT family glycosyltransferase|nr:glycosyl transferase family 1 [Paenibacillaceae bacterium]